MTGSLLLQLPQCLLTSHSGGGKGYVWARQHVPTPLPQGWCGYPHCWVPNLPTAETDAVPFTQPFPQERPEGYLVAGRSQWRGQQFVLTGKNFLRIWVCHSWPQWFCQYDYPCTNGDLTQYCFWLRSSFLSHPYVTKRQLSWKKRKREGRKVIYQNVKSSCLVGIAVSIFPFFPN